jgi:phage shock protein C
MYCTRCGVEINAVDLFCSHCRKGTAVAEMPRALMLDKRNKKIAGVCAGFARYCGIDLAFTRILWLAIALGTGVGFLVYLAAWIILPSDAGWERRETMAYVPRRM